MPVETGEELIKLAESTSGDGLTLALGGGTIGEAESSEGPEAFGLIAAAIVLLIAFGSVVAAGLPLAIALFGLGISSALIGVLAAVINVPDWTPAVVEPDRDRRRGRLRAARADAGSERSSRSATCAARSSRRSAPPAAAS